MKAFRIKKKVLPPSFWSVLMHEVGVSIQVCEGKSIVMVGNMDKKITRDCGVMQGWPMWYTFQILLD